MSVSKDEYFSLPETKRLLKFSDDDTEDDKLLIGFGNSANLEIINRTRQFVDVLPIIDDHTRDSMNTAACYYAVSLYKARNNTVGQNSTSDYWMKMFEKTIDSVISSMKHLQSNKGVQIFFKTSGNQIKDTL